MCVLNVDSVGMILDVEICVWNDTSAHETMYFFMKCNKTITYKIIFQSEYDLWVSELYGVKDYI